MAAADPARLRIRVRGQVQGVGFRPFVWREATRRGLAGWVGNDAAGVVMEVEGPAQQLDSLIAALHEPPPLARVDDVVCVPLPPSGGAGFEVRTSAAGGPRRALVPPDAGTCAACAAELRDPSDRRFGHPFVNCTSCGPRYTIVESVPYDRSRTTMAAFPMCEACRGEYDDPADRRFHAEPVCCPACGPVLQLLDRDGRAVAGEPVAAAAELLRAGGVLAVKGLGGYHLAVGADDEQAVATLRRRKHREERPFALMVRDLRSARELCEVDAQEQELLTSSARPIVLLRRRPARSVAPSVAPGSPTLGVMLPYTPLHALLLERCDRPLVLTSGNLSDEPIAFRDDDARIRLQAVADAILLHDRQIRTRIDDSVCRVVRGRPLPLRRSRGYVPTPVQLPAPAARHVLACGAALKSTFCLARGSEAFLSQHLGDLDDWSTLQSYVESVGHLSDLLDTRPEVVAHDLHPDYPSTRYALGIPDVETLAVQHHHAHVASCLADNGATGPVIGVAFDGVGLGTDGTAWGGEFLVADLCGAIRAAHLDTVPMPGGDAATRQPWRMAAAHLDAAYAGAVPAGLAVARRQAQRWDQVLAVARAGVNAPRTSSAGRLFDAVSSLLGVRDTAGYEGQAAIELEHVADPAERRSYPVEVEGDVVQVAGLVRAVTEDLQRGTSVPRIAARFHNALADVVLAVCVRLREEHDLPSVALSGGVFQNALLLTRCLDRLEGDGFTVLTHRQVPPNDGGISLGQAAVAAALLSSR
jgi:hydrogenase maturation protein HypF